MDSHKDCQRRLTLKRSYALALEKSLLISPSSCLGIMTYTGTLPRFIHCNDYFLAIEDPLWRLRPHYSELGNSPTITME
ncbi:hypothetical protein HAX54_001621, partial [Datura stramonium]|nr:hypothetical protein [Datura stramonium]